MSVSNPSASEVSAVISRLFVYPVKSCAGIEVSEALLTETGFDLDRAWMVVDGEGEFVTQRKYPRLALVRPEFKRSDLVLRAPGMLALHLHIDSVEQAIPVSIWDDEVPAYDMGDIAAQWFTDFLSLTEQGLPLTNAPKFRVVRFDPEHKRVSSLKWTAGVEALNQFSDGFPLLVLGQSSLDELNVRLQTGGHESVGIERFRPNIVLTGMAAHDEDHLGEMNISTETGLAVLKPVKPCPRCPIPNIDPATALSSPTVGDTLQTYRQNAVVNGAVSFGMNAIILSGYENILRVGQSVSADFKID